jgi:hypothetical protein
VSSSLFPMTRSLRKICKETWNDCGSKNTGFSIWILSFTYVNCCHLSTLNGIIEKIKDVQSVPPLKRAWTFVKDPEKIVGMRKDFDNAIGLFQVCINLLSFIESAHSLSLPRKLSATITTGLGVTEILEAVKNKLSDKGLHFSSFFPPLG